MGGVLSGILGIGGGIVFVPLLTYLTKEDFKINTGISSLAIVFVASSSAISYINNGLEISNYLLYLIAGAVLGGYLGSLKFNNPALKRMLAFVLVLACAKLFLEKNNQNKVCIQDLTIDPILKQELTL